MNLLIGKVLDVLHIPVPVVAGDEAPRAGAQRLQTAHTVDSQRTRVARALELASHEDSQGSRAYIRSLSPAQFAAFGDLQARRQAHAPRVRSNPTDEESVVEIPPSIRQLMLPFLADQRVMRTRNNGLMVRTSHVPTHGYRAALAELLASYPLREYSQFVYRNGLPSTLPPDIRGLPPGVAPLAEVQASGNQHFLPDSANGLEHHHGVFLNPQEQEQLRADRNGARSARYARCRARINQFITDFFARLGFEALSFKESKSNRRAVRNVRNNSLMQVLAFIGTFNPQNHNLALLTFAHEVARDEDGVVDLLSGGVSVAQIRRLLRSKAFKREDRKLVCSIMHYAAKKLAVTILYIHTEASSERRFV